MTPKASSSFVVGDSVSYNDAQGNLQQGTITHIRNDTANIRLTTGAHRKGISFAQLSHTCPSAANRKVFHWAINQRFQFLEQTIRLLLTTQDVPVFSAIISGQGGLGKTHTIMDTLHKLGYREKKDYTVIKGFTTPKGLFEAILSNPKVLILDDCKSALADSDCLELLKGATDSYPVRTITWNSGQGPLTAEFSGKIITITNRDPQLIDQALMTRSFAVDVTMTPDEIIERLNFILPELAPLTPLETRQAALALLSEHRHSIKELSIRTLLQTIACATSVTDTDWRTLALYFLTGTAKV